MQHQINTYMNNKDYEARIQELEAEVKMLREDNLKLMNRNMQLGQMVDAYYDVRRRIQMMKELVIRHQELLKHADLRDDDELMGRHADSVLEFAVEGADDGKACLLRTGGDAP